MHLSFTEQSASNFEQTSGLAGEQYLHFYLGTDMPPQEVALAASHLAGVASIPLGEVVPIPEMPEYIAGVYPWRGNILWIVELGRFLGFAVPPAPVYTTLIVQLKGRCLGLAVAGLAELGWIDPATLVTQSTPCLRGLPKPDGTWLLVLNSEAMIADLVGMRPSTPLSITYKNHYEVTR